MRARAVEIADRLVGSGVAVLMLKGAHTGSVHFPDPATRPCADIDMLVEADQYDLAQQLLRAMGYRRQFAGRDGSSWTVSPVAEVPRSLRLVHADDPWSVDLHHSLKGQCASVARSIFFDSALPFATAEGWPPFERASVLGQPLLLHQLAVHAGTALHNMTLLRAVELHLVIKQDCARGALEWGEFLRLGRSLGTLGFAWPALKLCEDLVPGTLPEVVVAQCFDDAPAAVRRVVSRLEPATAQRIERLSIAEHFMWARDVRGRLRQLARDLVPVFSPLALQQIYARRLWQALRGPVTR